MQPMHAQPSLARQSLPWRVLLVLLIGGISVLALTPAPPTHLSLGWDKLNHMLAFAGLALCATLGWRTPRWLRLTLLAALLAFGGLIELLQQLVPNRTAEWGDLGADAIGIAIGLLVASVLLRLARARPKPGR